MCPLCFVSSRHKHNICHAINIFRILYVQLHAQHSFSVNFDLDEQLQYCNTDDAQANDADGNDGHDDDDDDNMMMMMT